jgi:hypothetical protein
MKEFQSFMQKLTSQLTRERDLSNLEVNVKPVENKKTQVVTLTFEFAQPRTGHPDEGAGGLIRGHFEPGFFRRRRIMKLLTYTVRYDMARFKFFDTNENHGVISQRVYRHCSHSLDSTWFKVTIYFESPTGSTTEYPLFPNEQTYSAKDLGIQIPAPKTVWA